MNGKVNLNWIFKNRQAQIEVQKKRRAFLERQAKKQKTMQDTQQNIRGQIFIFILDGNLKGHRPELEQVRYLHEEEFPYQEQLENRKNKDGKVSQDNF